MEGKRSNSFALLVIFRQSFEAISLIILVCKQTEKRKTAAIYYTYFWNKYNLKIKLYNSSACVEQGCCNRQEYVKISRQAPSGL